MSDRAKHLLIVGTLSLAVGIAALSYAFQDRLDTSLASLTKPSKQETIENLRAFAKLYGYVRFFHPSDAAANTDWDKFAIHGVRQVRDAASRAELRDRLEILFDPIAPTVRLYRTGTKPPDPHGILTPTDTSGLNLVAWQHKGLGLDSNWPYYSLRLNRPTDSSSGSTTDGDTHEGRPVARAMQRLDVGPFQGKEVQLRAAVRTADAESKGRLFLHTYAPGCQDDPVSDPFSSQAWSRIEQTVSVPSNASTLMIGVSVQSPGTAWFDNVELLARDSPEASWEHADLFNSGFELGQLGNAPPGWRLSDDLGRQASIVAGDAYNGQRSLKLTLPPPSELRLFDARPRPGETIERPIGRGLSAQVPLALYSRNGQTLRPDGAPSPADLQARLDSLAISSDPVFFSANVAIAWNVFQHFYPYFGVVDVDWDQVLTRSLHRSLADRSEEEFQRTLQRLVARLQDGHGRVSPSPPPGPNFAFRLDRADGKVVVADTVSPRHTSTEVCPQPGDVVLSVDGTPIEKKLRDAKRYISGSAQYKDVEALEHFRRYMDQTSLSLRLRRDGKRVECQVHRHSRVPVQLMQTEPRPDPIATLQGGVYYVDLTRASWGEVREKVDVLAQARGVIFDVRGYPGLPGEEGGVQIVQHLSRDTLRESRQTPQLIYPDQDSLVGYAPYRATFAPKTPFIDGPVAFLTDARAISAGEQLMGIVKHYDLGTIVGQPTAGGHGTVNRTDLIGDYQVTWTGQRVRKHDGSQHHLVGIEPDVRAERTIEGVRQGRDEYLEKALEVLREGDTTDNERTTQ